MSLIKVVWDTVAGSEYVAPDWSAGAFAHEGLDGVTEPPQRLLTSQKGQ